MADASAVSLGQQVRIISSATPYFGEISDIDYKSGKLVLRNVTTAGTKLFGPQQFFVDDIETLELAEVKAKPQAQSTASKKKAESGLTHKKIFPNHIKKLKALDTDDLATSKSIFQDDGNDQGIGSGEDSDYEEFYEYDKYIIICRLGEKFRDMIEEIMQQDAVGVAIEGVEIGRNGTLSLILVSTRSRVIIFDMLRLGQEAFAEGLEAMFESRQTMKVMHDCRWISDMMHHVYSIQLNNIFDTQVASAFVYRSRNGGDWPRFVETLVGCQVNHLGIQDKQMHFMRVREASKQEDESVWLIRPLPEKLLALAFKNVCYLLQLKDILMKEMYREYQMGVELYLNHAKNAASGLVEKLKGHSHLLPHIFRDIPKLVSNSSKELHRKNGYVGFIDTITYDQNGFRDECLTANDDTIQASHHSIWHRSEYYYNDASGKMKPMGRKSPEEAQKCHPISDRNQSKNTDSNTSIGVSGSVKNPNSCDKHCAVKVDEANKNVSSSSPHGAAKAVQGSVCSTSSVATSSNTKLGSRSHGISHTKISMNVNSADKTDYSSFNATSSFPMSRKSPERQEASAEQVQSKAPPVTTDAGGEALEETSQEESSLPGISAKVLKSALGQALLKKLQRTSPDSQPRQSVQISGITSPSFAGASDIKISLPDNTLKSHTTSPQQDSISSSSLTNQSGEEDDIVERLWKKVTDLKFVPAKRAKGSSPPELVRDAPQTVSSHSTTSPLNRPHTLQQKTFFSDSSEAESDLGSGHIDFSKVASCSSSDADGPCTSQPVSAMPVLNTKKTEDLILRPAGSRPEKIGKKKAKRRQEEYGHLLKRAESNSAQYEQSSSSESRDLDCSGVIPMQHSLNRQTVFPLGVSSIGVGDPFLEDSCPDPSTISSSKKFDIGKSLQKLNSSSFDENSITDKELDEIERSEMFQNILKIALNRSMKKKQKKKIPSVIRISPRNCSK